MILCLNPCNLFSELFADKVRLFWTEFVWTNYISLRLLLSKWRLLKRKAFCWNLRVLHLQNLFKVIRFVGNYNPLLYLQYRKKLNSKLSNSYLIKVKNRSTRKICEIFSKLPIKTSEWHHWLGCGVIIVNFWTYFTIC